MKQNRHFLFPALAGAAAVLLIAVFALIPALGLWFSERAALEQPHARTARAGAVSLTCDDMYITRMLKKLAQGRSGQDSAYRNAAYTPDVMNHMMQGTEDAQDAAMLIDTAHTAGLLPDAWYESVCAAMDGTFYTATDSLGFKNCIAWSSRPEDAGLYLIGLTVETQTNAIVGLWASAEAEEALPAPDTAAVLAAYVRHLGVEQANDWGVPVDTDFAENSLYSANAELLLSVQSGNYISGAHYSLNEDMTEHARSYFCLNAQHMENRWIQLYQAYTRSFAGVPDMPAASGNMRTVQWSGTWGGLPAAAPDACYELAMKGIWIDAQQDTSGREALILKTDYAARRQSPLCAVPGCAHADETCPAYMREGDSSSLTCIEGKLYLMYGAGSIRAMEGKADARIVEIDPETGERRPVCSFPGDCEIYPSNLEWSDGRALYGTMYEYGANGFMGVRVDLATGAVTRFALHGGAGEDVRILGAAPDGLILAMETGEFKDSQCPIAAESERYRLTSAVYEPRNTRCVCYHISTGLRQELAFPAEVLDGMMSSADMVADGMLYCTQVEQRGKGGEAQCSIWQVDFFTQEMRLLNTFTGPDAGHCSVIGMLPAAAEGQADYLKLYSDGGNGAYTVYLLNVSDGELLTFSGKLAGDFYYMADIGPIAQTADGHLLTVQGRLETTWDDGRYSYALGSRETALREEQEEQIEMWLPEPALG